MTQHEMPDQVYLENDASLPTSKRFAWLEPLDEVRIEYVRADLLAAEKARAERWRRVSEAYKIDMHGVGYEPTESGWDDTLRAYNEALAAEPAGEGEKP